MVDPVTASEVDEVRSSVDDLIQRVYGSTESADVQRDFLTELEVELCAAAAAILLAPPPPIVTDRRAAAAADRVSASRRRRFRDVFTSCCKPAICC